MPGMLAISGSIQGRLQFRQLTEGSCIARGDFFSPLPHLIHFPELRQAHRGGHISHIVFEPRRDGLVIPRPFRCVSLPGVLADTVQSHDAATLGPWGVIGSNHATFAGGQRFCGIEGKTHQRGLQIGDWGLQIAEFRFRVSVLPLPVQRSCSG